jgi:hypothetical protein
MTLTSYDSTFLMINLIFTNKKITHDELPESLKNKNWGVIASLDNYQGKTFYNFDKKKIFDFL